VIWPRHQANGNPAAERGTNGAGAVLSVLTIGTSEFDQPGEGVIAQIKDGSTRAQAPSCIAPWNAIAGCDTSREGKGEVVESKRSDGRLLLLDEAPAVTRATVGGCKCLPSWRKASMHAGRGGQGATVIVISPDANTVLG
jgi:hypothetical protein